VVVDSSLLCLCTDRRVLVGEVAVKSSRSQLEQALEASHAGARVQKAASPPLVPNPESVRLKGGTLRNSEPKTTLERGHMRISTRNQEATDAHLNMDNP
jgi:hypothetical protein